MILVNLPARSIIELVLTFVAMMFLCRILDNYIFKKEEELHKKESNSDKYIQ